MIVQRTGEAAAPYSLAVARVLRQLTLHRMDQAATATVGETEPIMIRAGLAGVTKQVAICLLEPTRGPAQTVIPFRWVASGVSGELFPTLEANLVLRPAGQGHTEMKLVGSYQPPFGRAGQLSDWLLLRHVAEATVSRFLNDLIQAIATDTATEVAHGVLPHSPAGAQADA